MVQRLAFDLRRSLPERGRSGQAARAGRLMLFLFTLGVLAGGVAGTFFTADGFASAYAGAGQYVASNVLPASLLSAFWSSARLFLLLALAATSWLGVLLVPAAVMLRGYLLSCSIAVLYASFGWPGLLCAFLSSGLPALFLVPAFLAAACDAYFASRFLLERRFGLTPAAPGRRRAGKRVLVIAPLIAAEALYSFYLLPHIVAS